MPYKDRERAREHQRAYWARPEMKGYQAKRNAERRAAFFADKECVDCGSTENLELDHVDPATKIGHGIWLWSEARREAEIAKCVVRCRSCHQERHARERRRHGIGGYARGCRCDACRAAKSERYRRARDQRRARESNPPSALCRRVPSRSASPPGDAEPYRQLSLLEAAA